MEIKKLFVLMTTLVMLGAILIVPVSAAGTAVVPDSDPEVAAYFAGDSASGDSYLLEKSADVLNMYQQLDAVESTLSKDNLPILLADSSVSNEFGEADYVQLLTTAATARPIWVVDPDDDSDTPGHYVKVTDATTVYEYEMSFNTELKSDNDANDRLEDIEGKDFEMLGETYTLIKAEQQSSTAGNLKLTFMGGAESDTLRLGDTATYTIDGTTYEVEVTFVDSDEVSFTVNDEDTGKLNAAETYRLSDGTEIGVDEISYQDFAGGVMKTDFYVGAEKVVMEDTDITDSTAGSELTVGSDTLDQVTATISGSSANTDTGTDVTISNIKIIFTADDDYYIGEGKGLTDAKALDSPNQMFLNAFDIYYSGMEADTGEISIKNSGTDTYEVSFTNQAGITYDVPFVYYSGTGTDATNFTFGESATEGDGVLYFEEAGAATQGNISKGDYFVLSDLDESEIGNLPVSKTSRVLEYRGLDYTASSNKYEITFKDIGTGNKIYYTWTIASGVGDNAVIDKDIVLDGVQYGVAIQDTDNDAEILVDLNADDSIDANDEAIIVTENGAAIEFDEDDGLDVDTGSSLHDTLLITTEPDEDSAQDTLSFGAYVSAAGGDIELNVESLSGADGSGLLDRGDTDYDEGYTYNYGMYYEEYVNTGGPDTVEILYPDDIAEAKVYYKGDEATVGGEAKYSTVVPAEATGDENVLIAGPGANVEVAKLMGFDDITYGSDLTDDDLSSFCDGDVTIDDMKNAGGCCTWTSGDKEGTFGWTAADTLACAKEVY